jgi:hypothetical protein
MPSRKESRAKRRKKLFMSVDSRVPPGSLAELGLNPERVLWRRVLGERPPSGNSFDNPHEWDTFARGALDLAGDDIVSITIRTAFKNLRLDPANPFDWRTLVSYFAYVEFFEPRRGKAGAPKKWDKERLAELRVEMEKIRAGNARMTDKEIARRLARDPRFRTKAGGAAAGREGLRRAIRKARRGLP